MCGEILKYLIPVGASCIWLTGSPLSDKSQKKWVIGIILIALLKIARLVINISILTLFTYALVAYTRQYMILNDWENDNFCHFEINNVLLSLLISCLLVYKY